MKAAIARIKRWKFLAQILPTNEFPYIGDYIGDFLRVSAPYQRDIVNLSLLAKNVNIKA